MTAILDNSAPPAETATVDLAGRQRLTILRANTAGGDDILRLTAADGTTTLMVRVGPEGTHVELGAASLALRVEGDMAIDAGRIALHGRQGISISTGGDLVVRSDGKLLAQAGEQKWVTTLGDISLRANDDVKIDGERIRMNC